MDMTLSEPPARQNLGRLFPAGGRPTPEQFLELGAANQDARPGAAAREPTAADPSPHGSGGDASGGGGGVGVEVVALIAIGHGAGQLLADDLDDQRAQVGLDVAHATRAELAEFEARVIAAS